MRILLIGVGGQLAEDLRGELSSEELLPISHAELDISNPAAVAACVESARPGCILNTAAFNLVDACEERCEEATRVNTLGVYYLAREAQRKGAQLVHFSTNYVFDGEKCTPYVESDTPHPLSIYAQSKLGGEWAAQQYCEKHFVIRTAALYGRAGNKSKGGNFVERLLRSAGEGKPLRIVNDQIVNPTYTLDLARSVAHLIRTDSYGLFHAVNTGECSWFDFAREILRVRGRKEEVTPVTSAALHTQARRPAYSALENQALRNLGHPEMRPWQEALAEYISQLPTTF